VPQSDLRGRITSHRARSTIATQLFKREGANESVRVARVARASPTVLYATIREDHAHKADEVVFRCGYFGRNLRAIEVLIDQEKVRSGVGAQEAWKFYDLGHGYCTYDFFDQCPHRMACAKCSFYLPKESTAAACWKAEQLAAHAPRNPLERCRVGCTR